MGGQNNITAPKKETLLVQTHHLRRVADSFWCLILVVPFSFPWFPFNTTQKSGENRISTSFLILDGLDWSLFHNWLCIHPSSTRESNHKRNLTYESLLKLTLGKQPIVTFAQGSQAPQMGIFTFLLSLKMRLTRASSKPALKVLLATGPARPLPPVSGARADGRNPFRTKNPRKDDFHVNTKNNGFPWHQSGAGFRPSTV